MGKSLSQTHVCEWCKCFREGRECLENEPHDHRPQTSVTKPNADRTDALIRENRCITIKELGAMLSISVGSVEDIVKYHCTIARPPGNSHEGKVPIQVEDERKAGSLPSRQCTPPYSQDNNGNPPDIEMEPSDTSAAQCQLVPSDFYLFGRFKSDLLGMRVVEDVIQTVREWRRCQPQAFFEKGVRMLPKHCKKCVDSGGEYVED
ncbi:hypothetical protein B7P43_G04238 [Cryptotermes secundus]|uniref:Mos1 transposase HTH domain-containing protein n=1 Tax=Cryptotermes secundus TaxID=105785 RepID=A0A2J7QNA6_9NEOP|nr:hypothetical protein B7P43_G04238 [Cryptotermes secundus]